LWQEFKNSALLGNRAVAFSAIHKWSCPLPHYDRSGSLPSSLGWPKSSSTSCCTFMSILDVLGFLMQQSSWMDVWSFFSLWHHFSKMCSIHSPHTTVSWWSSLIGEMFYQGKKW
jgi:hypothetical protein